jgi:tetratricopeptide (TPR) repeat protein
VKYIYIACFLLILGFIGIESFRYYKQITIKEEYTEKLGELTINTIPTGADIFINNSYKGKSPIKIKSLDEGTYEVLIKKEGYPSYNRKIYLTPTKEGVFLFNLNAITVENEKKKSKEVKDKKQSKFAFYSSKELEGLIREGVKLYEERKIDAAYNILRQVGNMLHNNTIIKKYLNLIEKDRKKIKYLIGEGEKEYKNQNYENALVFFNEVKLLDPFNENANLFIVKIETLITRKDEIKNILKNAEEKEKEGDLHEAVRIYKKALKIDPSGIFIRDEIARLNKKILTSPKTGSIIINSTPFAREVMIDDRIYGPTPISINNIKIGEHTVVAKKMGYKTIIKKIQIEEGQKNILSLVLEKN